METQLMELMFSNILGSDSSSNTNETLSD